MLPHSFYLAFGNLLYAIAKSDLEIQDEEIAVFQQISKDELIKLAHNLEADDYDKILTDSGFLSSYDAEFPAEIALEKFIFYYENHKYLFNNWVKQFCINSVVKVAEAFEGIVTEEKQLINKLKEAFDH
jgi:hypothetical protein